MPEPRMSEPRATNIPLLRPEQPPERLARETARLAGLLARIVERVTAAASALSGSHEFLLAMSTAMQENERLSALRDRGSAPHPFDRLAMLYALSPVETDLVLLAGMPEEHEGYASVMRALHPRGESRPTTGLAAQLLCDSAAERVLLRQILELGQAVRSGIITLVGEGPFWERSIVLADALWPALLGFDAWPAWLAHTAATSSVDGLDDWLNEPLVARAANALRDPEPRLILVTADTEEIAAERALAIAAHADVGAERVTLPPNMGEHAEHVAGVHCALRGVVPVITVERVEGQPAPATPTLAHFPGPVMICARRGSAVVRGDRSVLTVSANRLSSRAQQRLWSTALPELGAASATLASRYNIEPSSARAVAGDVRSVSRLQKRDASVEDVAESVRTRSNVTLASGVSLVTPAATWDDLVLPPDLMRHLREIVGRLVHQGRVLDDWGFLERRRGARGVRVLFAGPPGTGKSLSAEVLATTLGVDLLVVDISRVVSKWIGETEKNLADVFDAAERTQAVLLFDEADALFGKRTEVKDAHDRYANLETAYLLTRLERFDGLAILTTNLRQHIDPAFTRRLEFVLDFAEPSSVEREALWRCHIPPRAPLAGEVRLGELAALYPIVGGLIRNAAVAAGFLATTDDGPITRDHLVRAVRREYEKAGRAFPGAPAGSAH